MTKRGTHPKSLANLKRGKQFTADRQPDHSNRRFSRRATFQMWLDKLIKGDAREQLLTDTELALPEQLTHFDAVCLRLLAICHHPDVNIRDRIQAIKLVFEYGVGKSDQIQIQSDPFANLDTDELAEQIATLREMENELNDDDDESITPAIVVDGNSIAPRNDAADGPR